ncbi:DNA-directed RNA polymerase subunit beta' [Caldanaerobius polysaccharolyticus]|uniref:DNA-directed RNA polymerase subunit beta' n=1 Tax=Caldanaerobius polysaccharolyticus TaxID=44256 RepID=UPI000478AA35
MDILQNFDAIRIGLASPEKIREWSRGEVKKPETINYRTLKPEKDGLFCERIFGPTKDWECHCGKYKRIRYKGVVCDRCGVEVTRSKVRRERMGHIELAAPVSHIWYFKGIPSRMGLILDMSPRALEKVLYFAAYVVIDPGDTPLMKKQVLTEKEYRENLDKYGHRFRAGMGAEAIKELLQEIDLDALSKELRNELKNSTGQKRIRILRRLEVVEAFRKSGNRPEWMILDVIPVIPPDLRPMVQLDGGRFATSDLNDLYRRVINRNNRLKRLLDLGAPEIIVRNEKRMLQEAVDALIDNGRRGRPVTGPGNRPLKSLSDMLKGKQGRFRQNLLGKRVDYSGRSVIVVGPELKLYQCGLPKEMALELFKPFVMKKIVDKGLAHNIKSAKRMVEKVRPEVWDILEEVIKDHPVLLNRAPTLHRLGIQAFQPVLVEGRAIKLHPLVCTAYNADFDGDQMAVHVPLSVEAQAESRFLMLAATNILKPQDGKPVMVPTQDMVLGCYYLTGDRDGEKGEGKVFSSVDEVLMAYQLGEIGIHAKIKVRVKKEIDGQIRYGIIDATPGKLIFNEAIPQDLGFVDRSKPGNEFKLEIDFLVDKKMLGVILDRCYRKYGPTKTAEVLDKIKALGYKYSTKGAITVSVSDIEIPEEKPKILEQAEKEIERIEKLFRRGLISDEERYERVIDTWNRATEEVTEALMNHLDRFNPIFMMAHSGARGSKNQIRQLAGMRGLMGNPSGRIIELPIRSNFREGLTSLEFFISTHGARKGLADTALRTADSGYLTRRLVDVSQDVIVREEDCGTDEGIYVSAFKDGNEVIEKLEDRIIGRTAAEDVVHPATGEIIVAKNQEIKEDAAKKIIDAGIQRVKIRSVLTCKSRLGICAKCYGRDLATGNPVNIGEAVGIIAAQAIGEPGTQLTMRTFHTGGVAGADITQGLPRVEELFEARKPKGLAIISEIPGVVKVNETKKKREVVVTNNEIPDSRTYLIPYGAKLKVTDGQIVEAGDELTEGSVNPHDILRIKGVEAVQTYLLQEVQRVYRLQGVEINDKHIEIIIRQMLKKVKIEDEGDTDFLPGSLVDINEFNDENKRVEEKGGRKAVAKPTILGITKAALATDSFLSSASFQETTRVLTDAAIKAKLDPLIGLKENVIIGKLIPAGTGLSRYRNINIKTNNDVDM